MKRKVKLAVLHAARLLGLFWLSRMLTPRGVRILCYHGVWLGKEGWRGDAMFIGRETFAQRLADLAKLQYPVISLATAVKGLRGEIEIPRASVVITIDDGWFSTYDAMVPALRERRMPATLYCDTAHLLEGLPIAHVMARYCRMLSGSRSLQAAEEALYKRATDFAAPMQERLEAALAFCHALGIDAKAYIEGRVFGYMTAEELRETSRAGIDIELHTHNHTLGDMTPTTIADEIMANRHELSKLLGREPTSFSHFCYPSGVTSPQAAASLAALDVSSSTTTENSIAFPGDPMQMLPRFLDGEQVSSIEFQAEISGFSHLVRQAMRRATAVFAPQPVVGSLKPIK